MKTKDKYLITKYIKTNMGITYTFIAKKYGVSIPIIRRYLSGEYRSADIESVLIEVGIPKSVIEEHFRKLGKKNLKLKTQTRRKAFAYVSQLEKIKNLSALGVSLRAIWKIISVEIEEDKRITYCGFYRWLQRTGNGKAKITPKEQEGK